MFEKLKRIFITTFVVIVMIVLFWTIITMDRDLHPNLPQNQPTPIDPAGPGKPNLEGFEALGLPWDCKDSSYTFKGVEKQVITASGDSLLFYCDPFGIPLTKFCEEGVSIRKLGMHDGCK